MFICAYRSFSVCGTLSQTHFMDNMTELLERFTHLQMNDNHNSRKTPERRGAARIYI